MAVNSKRVNSLNEKRVHKNSHRNFMDGTSFDISNPIHKLRVAAASCFFGEPTYYGETQKASPTFKVKFDLTKQLGKVLVELEGDTAKNTLEKCIDKALDFSVKQTLELAAHLRNTDNIRTTPQVILVRAANHKGSKGTQLIRRYAKEIVKRADEPAVCVAYHKSAFKGVAIPSSLKRALAYVLTTFSEYELAKYKMENREVKTVDVINLVHPVPTPAIDGLVKGTLKNTETWESMRSQGKSWDECVPVMGHMALLRNLRNFVENNANMEVVLDKLVKTAEKGKQLPFRYWTAYKELKAVNAPGSVLDAIENCLNISLHSLPQFKGRTMSLCDNSGSAQGTTTSQYGSVKVSEIANLTGIITGKVSNDGYLGVFGDKLETFSIRKNSSIFDDLKNANSLANRIGKSTENGIWLFWRDAIAKAEHWDNVFIYSDMQAGHGGLYGRNPDEYSKYLWYHSYCIDVPMLVNTYRKNVNPKVNVYLVQVAGYTDTIMPEVYDRTYILGGWSDGILRYAKEMSDLTER